MRISNIPHEESRIFKFIRQVSNNTIIYIFTALKEGLGLAILSHITVRVSSRRQNAALVMEAWKIRSFCLLPSLIFCGFNKGVSRNMHLMDTIQADGYNYYPAFSARFATRVSLRVSLRSQSRGERFPRWLKQKGETAGCTNSRGGCRGSGLEAVDGRTDLGCFRKIHYTMADPSEYQLT